MNCPGCKIEINDKAKSCGCGWYIGGSAMPTLPTLIVEMNEYIKINSKDRDTLKKAEWFLRLIEPETAHERPLKAASKAFDNADKVSWEWKYSRRVMYCLRKFMGMSDSDKKMIVSAREDKIFWRGDDMNLFLPITAEIMKMRDMGAKAYREQHCRNLPIRGM